MSHAGCKADCVRIASAMPAARRALVAGQGCAVGWIDHVHLARSSGIVRAGEPAFSPRRRPSDELPVNFPVPKNDSLFGAKNLLFRAEQGIRRKAVKLLGK